MNRTKLFGSLNVISLVAFDNFFPYEQALRLKMTCKVSVIVSVRHRGDGGAGGAIAQFWGKSIQTNKAQSKSGEYFENLSSF